MNIFKKHYINRSLENTHIHTMAEGFNRLIHIDEGKLVTESAKGARLAIVMLFNQYETSLHFTYTAESKMQFNRLVDAINTENYTSTALFAAKCLFIVGHGNKIIQEKIIKLDAQKQGIKKLSADRIIKEIKKLESGSEDVWAIKAQALVSDFLMRKGISQYELSWAD